MKSWLAFVSFGVITSFAVSAVADENHNGDRQKRVFRAQIDRPQRGTGRVRLPPVGSSTPS